MKELKPSIIHRLLDAKEQTFLNYLTTKRLLKIQTIMNAIGIIDGWAIGGSCAAFIWGIPLNRTPHDLDIIVDMETFYKIKMLLVDNPLFKDITPSASVDYENHSRRMAFMLANGEIVDFIVNLCKEDIRDISIATPWGRTIFPQYLLEAKKHYKRAKDEEDMQALSDYISNNLKDESFSMEDDINALAKLRDKLAES